MKKTLCMVCLLSLAATRLMSQSASDEREWNATLKAVDESGQPVEGAHAIISYFVKSQPAKDDGLTDQNGLFAARHFAHDGSINELGFKIEKQGYYSDFKQYILQSPYDASGWNPVVTLALKKIKAPIAMYAKRTTLKVPADGKPVGYDFMVGDWVGPYGGGVNADILIEKESYDKGSKDYYSKITVTFPRAGDGIQVYAPTENDKPSDFRSPHEAPSDGYNAGMTRETSALPGQPSKSEYDPDRIYFFRIRTVLDHSGNVVSAHYGKIYGDFMSIEYFLNPTPNSRNLEFDPKQNLIGGLQSFEQVNAP